MQHMVPTNSRRLDFVIARAISYAMATSRRKQLVRFMSRALNTAFSIAFSIAPLYRTAPIECMCNNVLCCIVLYCI